MPGQTSVSARHRKTPKLPLPPPHHVMNPPIRLLLAMALVLGPVQPPQLPAREPDKRVRTIYHEDGRKTLSEKDNNTGVLKEYTYDERNALLLRKQFQIDSKGRARRGQVFDARQNLLARIEYGFDDFGRVEEERMFDARGNVIRRLLYKYDYPVDWLLATYQIDYFGIVTEKHWDDRETVSALAERTSAEEKTSYPGAPQRRFQELLKKKHRQQGAK